MYEAVVDAQPAVYDRTDGLKAHILDRLEEEAVISLDALIQMLPQYSWNQIFSAVDQLARDGSLVLRRHQYDYTLFSTAYPT